MASPRVLPRQAPCLLAASRTPYAIVRPRYIVPARDTAAPCIASRWSSTGAPSAPEAPDYLNESELKIFNKLKQELSPSRLEVQDISGGCGSMYALDIVSSKFKGLPVIKQHRLVNQVLGEEIKGWHGVQLKTKAA
ncbi:bola protein [Cryomyces antarcticus]